MKIILLLITTIIISCSSVPWRKKNHPSILMHKFWLNNSSRDQVVKVLGQNFQKVESGIIYNFTDSNFPEMGLFFDQDNRLYEQFIFLDKPSLQYYKKEVGCTWQEVSVSKKSAHHSKTIIEGHCTELPIQYENSLTPNLFQLKWKKKE